MKTLIFGLTAALALPVSAQVLDTDFSLQKRGTQVCRVKSGQAEQCLPTVESQSVFGKQPDGYELVDQLKKWNETQAQDGNKVAVKPGEVGGAFLVDSAKSEKIVKTFSRLSLRNLALRAGSGEKRVPFFASIYWKSASTIMNGTIHIEGYVDFSQSTNLDLNNIETLRSQIENWIQVTGLADSATEQDIKALRVLENAGRAFTFRVIGVEGQTTDEKTIGLIKQVAGPMIFGQIILAPAVESMAEGFAKGIAEALGRAIEQGIKGTFQNLR